MAYDPAALPDDIEALKAALLSERARADAAQTEAAVARAEQSDAHALIVHLKLQIEKLPQAHLAEYAGSSRPMRTKQTADWVRSHKRLAGVTPGGSSSSSPISPRMLSVRHGARRRRIVSRFASSSAHPWSTNSRAGCVRARQILASHNDVAQAMDYMLKRWQAFTQFLHDGRICLTDNAA